jgi:hypothetical protein
MYASVCVLYILFCLLDLQTLDPLTLACACVCAGGGLRTESILYEGWWSTANDEQDDEERCISKNKLVDEAWMALEDKGVDKAAWIQHIKWSGEAGKANGIQVPAPARARRGSHTKNHTPVYKVKGKGKSKAKGKSKGKGKTKDHAPRVIPPRVWPDAQDL